MIVLRFKMYKIYEKVQEISMPISKLDSSGRDSALSLPKPPVNTSYIIYLPY